MEKIYFDMSTKISFGKHKNKTIRELFENGEISYINWLFKNVPCNLSKCILIELERIDFENKEIIHDLIR